jgi:hypothetical protein
MAKSANGTTEKTAAVMKSMSMGARGSVGMKRIVSGGSQSSAMSNVGGVNKSSIKGPDKGEG